MPRDRPDVHPLKLFRAMRDMTFEEAGAFFDLSPAALIKIEHGQNRTPEWMSEWLADPMMTETEIQRRVDKARAQVRSRQIKRSTRGTSNPLVQWRKAKGWTQAQVAEFFGVHRLTVSKWEIGDQQIPERIQKTLEDENDHQRQNG